MSPFVEFLLIAALYQVVLNYGAEALWRIGLWKLDRNIRRREGI